MSCRNLLLMAVLLLFGGNVYGQALQAGDADQDYDFDAYDLVLSQQGGKYLTGQAADWSEGDWNAAPGGAAENPPGGNGIFDQLDIIAALNANNYRTGPYADQTTPLGQGTPIAANGTLGDDQTSIVYHTETGEVSVDAPSGTDLTSLIIDSSSGIFTGDAAERLGGPFDIDIDTRIFKVTFGGSFDSISFENVAAAGLSEESLLEDLRATGSLAGGGSLGAVDLVVLGPPLQAGDADQDYDFDAYDLVLSQQGGKYLTGQAADWSEGDWNAAPGGAAGNPPGGNGIFDQLDIIAALNANNYRTGPYADQTTPLGQGTPIAANGTLGDNQTSIVYDAETGEVSVEAPSGTDLTSLIIDSSSGIFTGDAAERLDGPFDIDIDTRIFKVTFGGSFDSISFENVAAAGLSEESLLEDLRATGSLAGGGSLGAVDLVVLGPPLQAGDADQDYDFDAYDLVLSQQGGKYLTGQAADWSEGDWNAAPGGAAGNPPGGNGIFDQLDIIAALNANNYRTGPYADQTTPLGQGTPIAANGTLGDDQTSIVYHTETGEVSVDAPSGTELTSLIIDSSSGIFTGDAAERLGGPFDIDIDTRIFKVTFGGSFDSISFENVAAAGLSEESLLEDLRATGSLAGGGILGAVDLVYTGAALEFRRGDGNADGRVDIGDAYAVFHSLVNPGFQLSCSKAADADDSGVIRDVDGERIFDWLFSGGLAPLTPGPFDCGIDGTPDGLDCRLYAPAVCGSGRRRSFDDRFAFVLDGVPESVEGAPGSTVTFDVRVRIENEIPVRAWSTGILARGDIRITAVRTDRTRADISPRGLRSENGFEETQVSRRGDQAMSAIILNTKEDVELPETREGNAPNDVLILTIVAGVPAQGAGSGSLEFDDRVRVFGEPVENLVTYEDRGRLVVARPRSDRRTFTIGAPPCPPDPVDCIELQVDGPVGDGPGEYRASMRWAGGSGSPLRSFSATNQETGETLNSGVQQQTTTSFELTEGTWIISGSATDGPDCPVSACEDVTQVVRCVEEPDSVSISGLTEGQVGSIVELVATFLGADEGSQTGFVWDIVDGNAQLIGGTDGPVARVRSTAQGDVTVRVRAADQRCGNVVGATHSLRFEDCRSNATCQSLSVTGPEDGGPGLYVATLEGTVPGDEQALYLFRVQNPETGSVGVAGPGRPSVAEVELPPGRWIFSAAVGVGLECPFDACSPVEVVVRCFEEPDAVEIVGTAEAQVGDVVELMADLSGADAGGALAHEWELVSGAGEIVGAANTSSVEVTSATGGEVRVRVRSGDGTCEDEAEAVHAILFQDCLIPEAISCDGVEVARVPDVSGVYVVTASATIPQNEDALYHYLVENLQTGQSTSAGPSPQNQVTVRLPVGTWEIKVSVGVDPDCPPVACDPVRVVVEGVGPFVRGDCNADQRINIADAICVLDWLLSDGSSSGCVAANNFNGDGGIDTSDAIYMLLFLSRSGSEPPAPFPSCGWSTTDADQEMGCETLPSYCQ